MEEKLIRPSFNDLSESEEMYLATIARVQERQGSGPAPLSQIADALEVLSVSANQMVRKLEEARLVIYTPYKGVELTEAGLLAAQRTLHLHRLWEVFLVEFLHYTPEESDPLACRLEHALPAEAAERLAHFLDNATGSFSGEPALPQQDQPSSQIFTIPLSQARLNEKGRIAATSGDVATRSFLSLQGMSVGTVICLLASSGSEILVESETGRVVQFSAKLAETIRIIPE